MYIYVYICIYIYIYSFIYLSMLLCPHSYVYVYIYIYTCTCAHAFSKDSLGPLTRCLCKAPAFNDPAAHPRDLCTSIVYAWAFQGL